MKDGGHMLQLITEVHPFVTSTLVNEIDRRLQDVGNVCYTALIDTGYHVLSHRIGCSIVVPRNVPSSIVRQLDPNRSRCIHTKSVDIEATQPTCKRNGSRNPG